MMGSTHALTGAAAFLAASSVLPFDDPVSIAIGAVTAAGWALAPDLDHPHATASKRFGLIGGLASRVVSFISGGHRKGTHSLLAATIVALLSGLTVAYELVEVAAFFAALAALLALPIVFRRLRWFPLVAAGAAAWAVMSGFVSPQVVAVAVPLGFFTHLLGDFLTPGGISWLYPFSPRRFSFPLFRTGSIWETGFRWALGLGLLVVTAQAAYPTISTLI